MIRFSCKGCGQAFSLENRFAGRRAKCKSCGAILEVPNWQSEKLVITLPETGRPRPVSFSRPTDNSAAPVPIKISLGRTSMRMRRLGADQEQMMRTFRTSPLIQILSTSGTPSQTYQIAYAVQGLARGPNGGPVVRAEHLVEIQLTSEYPRQSPKCKILTPIFHPNFDPTTICVGDHWTAGERLVDLVIRIGEMIAYQAYNIKSPLDGEAAMWTDLHKSELPVDARDLSPPDMD